MSNTFSPESVFLVTGGAGFIGSNIIEVLLDMGYTVRCLDNLSTGYIKNIEPFLDHPKFTFLKGDIRKMEDCLSATLEVDYVIHQAAWGSVPRSVEIPLEYNENNITGTLNMMEACVKNKVKSFVYASSAAVYGDDDAPVKQEHQIGKPLSPYAFTKVADEQYGRLYAELYGLNTVGLRYFNVFGKNQDPNGSYASVIPKFIKEIIKDEQVHIFGDGGQTRDFVYISNVVQANVLAALHADRAKGQVFNVAYGDTVTLLEVYNELCNLLGKHPHPVFDPERVGDIRHSSASIEKIKQQLNYQPQTGLLDGLRETIDWYRKNL